VLCFAIGAVLLAAAKLFLRIVQRRVLALAARLSSSHGSCKEPEHDECCIQVVDASAEIWQGETQRMAADDMSKARNRRWRAAIVAAFVIDVADAAASTRVCTLSLAVCDRRRSDTGALPAWRP
jgi:hypothetical protein